MSAILIGTTSFAQPKTEIDPVESLVLAVESPALDSADYITFRHDHPLQNARIRFDRDKQGTVVFMGGSITAGGGWRDLVCEDLRQRFPETEFTFINAGIGSTGSITGAMRFVRDVLAHDPVDLFFEEAAVNDAGIGFSDLQQSRGMEGIIRHAIVSNPNCDVVVMHFVDPGKIQSYNNGQTPQTIENHEQATEHYDVTTIHLAKEVTERIVAGEFTWDEDFKNLHPSPFGHRLYAHTIATMFDLAWAEELPDNSQPLAHEVPDPLDPLAYFNAQLISPDQASDILGFELIESWRPSDGAGTRRGFVDVPMLVATTPDDSLRFEFSGTAAGIWITAGPDAGIIQYRVDHGDWQELDTFTRHSHRLHLPRIYLLADDLERDDHTLEIKLSPRHNDRSAGTACRIMNFVVNE